MLKIAALVNGNAKNNRVGQAEKERQMLRRALRSAKVDITTKADIVRGVCQDYIKEPVDVVMVSGGDGTIQNFMTHYFIENYRKFGKGIAPMEFARRFNRMAMDPGSGVCLPAIYHRKKGTVNFYAETMGMEGDVDTIAENTYAARSALEFARAYVPVMMIYSKENPNDLDALQLMTLYGDGFAYNFFEQYYEPKKRGEDSTFFTAAGVIARVSVSAALAKVMDDASRLLFASTEISRRIYRRRYADVLVPKIRCEVRLDGERLPNPERTVIAMASMGAKTYGLHISWRLPGRAKDFRAYFPPRVAANPELLNSADYRIHFMGGNPTPVELSKMVPSFFLGKKANARHVTDTTARRVEIKQEDPLRFICDGSRQSNGSSAVIEIAYLQPFILLDNRPCR
jgi:diacylglycerol kinase family enzyme